VFKKRSGPHEATIREFRLSPGQMIVGEALRDFQGVLTGVPQFLGSASSILKAPDGQR
jgi:circadian clock protein KaiC